MYRIALSVTPVSSGRDRGLEQSIVERVADEQGEPAIAELDAAVIAQLARFSTVASRWIARGRVAEPVAQEETHDNCSAMGRRRVRVCLINSS